MMNKGKEIDMKKLYRPKVELKSGSKVQREGWESEKATTKS